MLAAACWPWQVLDEMGGGPRDAFPRAVVDAEGGRQGARSVVNSAAGTICAAGAAVKHAGSAVAAV